MGILKKANVWIWIIALAAGLGVLGYKVVMPSGAQQKPPAPPAGITVTVYEVQPRIWEIWRSFYGTVRSAQVQRVNSNTREVIEDIAVEVGDHVKKGDILISLASQSQAAVLSARQAAYEDARSRYESLQKLYRAGGTSKQELDRANVQLKDESAKLRDARTTVSRTQIRSALNGVVVRRSAEKGEFAEPGRELLAVADFDRREVEMLVSPTIRGLIIPGMDVLVKAPWGGETMGKIFRMDPEADAATGFFRAIVRLPAECRLIPGDYVRMEVRMVRRENTIAVPYESILREDGNPFVFVVSGEGASKRPIVTGEGSGGYVEVSEGLSPGEKVVKTGAGSLYDGARLIISNGMLKKPEQDSGTAGRAASADLPGGK
ncbi:Multidrug resistance protein MdtA [bioreactor metagenome]|jgi:RND family efflux transporter MFP subunit|uniref:Multidrug resistance protein MdtA n=1 Tax=bioreactor metagenome TaxID=1076179 RepID=A0A644XG41_9ZZZZ|nr:efflux RND transporter periplasmic adaptor subunit [Aminivibrio sp.]MDD3514567.1 efflux RND transporter periplasmic adaptor subunit [Synergistaceae bacterium]MEA4952452.1 efflux RND transporter periplasmic adaptor subunit [Aminivibrio sp.]HPF85366.1 efflux RND transporter periplasmic adaptor subunit [Aminivibrio sp.]